MLNFLEYYNPEIPAETGNKHMYTNDLSTTLSMYNLSCKDGIRDKDTLCYDFCLQLLSFNLKMLLHSTMSSLSQKVLLQCFLAQRHKSLPHCSMFVQRLILMAFHCYLSFLASH